jgi:hypothetical protein
MPAEIISSITSMVTPPATLACLTNSTSRAWCVKCITPDNGVVGDGTSSDRLLDDAGEAVAEALGGAAVEDGMGRRRGDGTIVAGNKVMESLMPQPNDLSADSDEAGRGFRFEAGHDSDLKPAAVPI